MALGLRHTFQSTVDDRTANGIIKPSHWNSEHTITCEPQRLLGRDSLGTGPVGEISVYDGIEFTGDGRLRLKDTAVTPGTYSRATITVDAKGRITAASANSAGSGMLELSDDLTPSLGGNLDPNGFIITGYSTTAEADAAYQPKAANLTEWATLNPSANAGSLVTAADYAAMKALLDLEIGTDVQAWSANLDEYSAVNPSANALTIFAHTFAQIRADLDLEAGTDFYSIAAADAAFQPKDTTLTNFAALTIAADKLPYGNGADTFAVTDFTSVARTLVGQSTQALMRTTGLGMSSNGSSFVSAADYDAMTALLSVFVGDSGSGGAKGLVPATVAGDSTKFLRGDGTFVAIPGGGDALTSGDLSQFAATSSAQLRGVLSDETGTGLAYFQGGDIGTPSAGVLTNATGLPTAGLVNAAVTYAKFQDVTGLSVVGRSTNSSGVTAAITGTDGQVLRVSGTALGFGTIVAAGIASDAVITAKILDNNVTLAKIAQGTALSLLGVTGNAGANYADIAAGSDHQVMRRSGTAIAFGAVNLAQSAAATGVLQAACAPVLTGAVAAAGGTSTTTATADLVVVIGDGTNVITTGVKGYFPIDFAGNVTGWTLVADASGSIVIDVWKDTYANFPPVDADSIAGSELPTLSSVQKNQDTSLSTWTSSGAFAAGDVFGFNVDSATTVKQVTLTLKVTKTS